MYTDAHCHPSELLEHQCFDAVVNVLSRTPSAASAWNPGQWRVNESIKQGAVRAGGPPLAACFGVHPQFPAASRLPGFCPGELEKVPFGEGDPRRYLSRRLLPFLETLASEQRVDAIGESGFDLFDGFFKETEKIQDEIFRHHLEVALRYRLPMVIHLRKASHKAFEYAGELKKLPAVIFHSWAGTELEGESLLRRGINAYFSFGSSLINNHKQARRFAARFSLDRLLTETDAPYMPLRGKRFSSPGDLPAVCQCLADLRGNSPGDLEIQIAANFQRAFWGAFTR